MAPRPALGAALLLASVTVVACAAIPPGGGAGSPAAPAGAAPWIETAGTTTLGFGVLRVAPPPGSAGGRFRVRFTDAGDGGYASDATSAVVIVLPGDALSRAEMAYADSWIGFGRAQQPAGSGPVAAAAEFSVDRDRTVVVAYGPWDGADTGRPPSDRHTFTLAVEPLDGGAWRWVESEAGEMVTTNWTRRPGVARGGPARDPLTGRDVWIESRVLVLYDPKNARSADAVPADEEESERLPLPPSLYGVLERVPIRWR